MGRRRMQHKMRPGLQPTAHSDTVLYSLYAEPCNLREPLALRVSQIQFAAPAPNSSQSLGVQSLWICVNPCLLDPYMRAFPCCMLEELLPVHRKAEWEPATGCRSVIEHNE